MYEGADTDSGKIDSVFHKLRPNDAYNYTHRRLGNARSDGSCRPLLVIMESDAKRKELLDATGSVSVNPVKIKKDQHPALRKEWRRLFLAEADEKKRPENAGCTIHLDRKQRVLLKDGIIIDRFQPNF